MNELLCILLVEDNPADVDLIREMLPESGAILFKIDTVPRLGDALALLKKNRFDMVLLDLGLPDSGGLDTFHKLNDTYPNIPIIVLTGNNDQQLAVTAVKEGAQDYLVKGQVVGNLLVRSVLYALERKHSEESLRESEERYRHLYETIEQGVVHQAADGSILSANPAAGRILGLSLEQMMGRTSLDPRWRCLREDGTDFPGDEHPSMVALRTGKPLLGTIMGVFHPTENQHRWILIDAVPEFRPGESTPYRMYTIFSDITEQKLAEEKIRSQLEELQRWQEVMLGREDRLQDLKQEINELCRRVGEPPRYPSQEADPESSVAVKAKT
jgi:CheY-like chemotaxis protein